MAQIMYYRSDITALPPIPMPFYAYGTGISELHDRDVLKKNGRVNPFVELMFGVDGIGEIVLYGQPFQIHPGDSFYYLPGEDHLHRSLSSSWHVRWVCFDGPLAEAVMLSCRYPRYRQLAQPVPERLFRELEHNIGDDDPLQVRRMAAVIMEILAYSAGAAGGMRSELLTKRCAEFIVAHLSDPQLDVGMLCDKLKVSRSTLTQIFTARMGCAPGRYIRDHRMAHGIALLRGTSLPVNEIAHRCGFAEARSFSRLIRRGTRLSPLELRKQGGGNCAPPSGATKTES